jgi:hypothetical protein
MSVVTIPGIRLRTTSDGSGFPHRVVTGTGSTPQTALASLAEDAEAAAEQMAAAFADDARADAVVSWAFEVVDVHLIMGNPVTARTWAAYGTLCSQGADPWDSRPSHRS